MSGDAVSRTSVYKAHWQRDTANPADTIYAQAGGRSAQLKLTRRPRNQRDDDDLPTEPSGSSDAAS